MVKSFKCVLTLIIIINNYSYSQEFFQGLTLTLHNKEIPFYEFEIGSNKNKELFIEITITNNTPVAYLLVLEPTTFSLFDELDYFGIEIKEERLSGSPKTIFWPWLKVYDKSNKEVFTNFAHYKPVVGEFKDLEIKKSWKKRSIKEKKADKKYGHMATEDLPDMHLFYYYFKKYSFVLKPNESKNFSVPIQLPRNYLPYLGSWFEYIDLKSNENYTAVVEIDFSDNRLYKILTPQDIIEYQSKGIKIFNGKIRSNEVEMTPNN